MPNLNVSILDHARRGSGAGAPVHLQRIDPARNMARFYSMAVEQDLFGRVVLVRRWGRLGTAGRTRMDEHKGEVEALAALTSLQFSKRRRGYRDKSAM
jgi:predicted DNA-binding WGR domain protein